jgi:uncharacterized protein with HEPN domain
MLNYANHAYLAIAGLDFETFARVVHLHMVVERGLEIVGEAARSLSPEFKDAHPEIPWRQIVGLRNVLIHRYGELDPQAIWRIANEDLPKLMAQIRALLPPQPPDA